MHVAENRSRSSNRAPLASAGNSVAFNAFPWDSGIGQYSVSV